MSHSPVGFVASIIGEYESGAVSLEEAARALATFDYKPRPIPKNLGTLEAYHQWFDDWILNDVQGSDTWDELLTAGPFELREAVMAGRCLGPVNP